jgi:CTP synthase
VPLQAPACPEEQRRKIALFTNVEERAVISGVDADDIYKIPLLLREQALDEIVVNKLGLTVPQTELTEWRQVVAAKANPDGQVDIAMVGKYVQARDSYISLNEALTHGGLKTRTRVNVHYIESTDIEQHGTHVLSGMDAILVPGGFGERGIEGKIAAVRYAREHGIPYLGICLGMQIAIVEFGRNVLGLDDANSTEFNRATPHPVIALIAEWQDTERGSQQRDEKVRQGRHHASGGAGSAARARYQGARLLRPRHDLRAPSSSLRVQQQLHGSLHARRPASLPACRVTDWWRSSNCPVTIHGSWRRSSILSSPPRRATDIRCSQGSSAPPARTVHRSCPLPRVHEARRIQRRC